MSKQPNPPILGQEAVASHYGLGRVTSLDEWPDRIGVTPYIADYQMQFDPRNIRLVHINFNKEN